MSMLNGEAAPDSQQTQEVEPQDVKALRERLAAAERETRQIAAMHQALLPEEPPTIAGVSLAVSHVAPNQAGGDYYDFIPLHRGEDLEPDPASPWLIVIADASGHGPAAAMIMAMLQATLHAYTGEERDPGQILAFVNEQMADKLVEGAFITAVFAILDPSRRTLVYSTAGHHPPALREPDGRVQAMDISRGGPPLGVVADFEFGSHEHRFSPGQGLLCYTDGAIEVRNADGDEFGCNRLHERLSSHEGEPHEILRQINRAIRRHRGGEEQEDDKTLVYLRFD